MNDKHWYFEYVLCMAWYDSNGYTVVCITASFKKKKKSQYNNNEPLQNVSSYFPLAFWYTLEPLRWYLLEHASLNWLSVGEKKKKSTFNSFRTTRFRPTSEYIYRPRDTGTLVLGSTQSGAVSLDIATESSPA